MAQAQKNGAGSTPAEGSENDYSHSNNDMIPRSRLNQEIEKTRQLREELAAANETLQKAKDAEEARKAEEAQKADDESKKEMAELRKELHDLKIKPIEDKVFTEYGVKSPNVLKKQLTELSSNLSPDEVEKELRKQLDTFKEQEDYKLFFSDPQQSAAKTGKTAQAGNAEKFKGMSKVPGGRETGQEPESIGVQLAKKHNQRHGTSKPIMKQE